MSSRRPTVPELPDLDGGINRLAVDADEKGPLQSLAIDHVLTTGGDACWIDARARARTATLARLAPDSRLLDRIRVARGFTAHQHHALLERVESVITTDTTLLVCPAVDGLYRDADYDDGKRLFEASLDRLNELVQTYDVTALVTVTRADAFTERLTESSTYIRCERTEFGPRFVGEDFETLVYPGDGYVQTTLAFWARVLTRRQAADVTPPMEVPTIGAN